MTLSGQASVGSSKPNAYTESAITDLSTALSKLTATATYDSISLTGNGTQKLQSTAKTNVIYVKQDISLSGQSALTLSGAATDVFVVNVAGNIDLSGQSSIHLDGGLVAKNVVFNNTGSGKDMSITGALVSKGALTLSGQGSLSGLTAAPYCPPTPTPSPTPTPTPHPSPSPSASASGGGGGVIGI